MSKVFKVRKLYTFLFLIVKEYNLFVIFTHGDIIPNVAQKSTKIQ